MNSTQKSAAMERIARCGMAGASVLALALAMAGASLAQAQPQASAAKPEAVAAKTTAPAAQSAPKGQSEGIKVHGHWTIEVRNPDGKVVTRREFENSLGGFPFGNGAGLLAGILGRIVTPGSWQVSLIDPTLANQVIINEPNSAASSECLTLVSTIQAANGAGSCSNNLSVAGPQLTTGGIVNGSLTGGTLTFTGSGTVPSGFPATIGVVNTADFACVISDSPVSCTTDSTTSPRLFTLKNLDGNTPAGAAAGDPNPVPVSAGQTVGVTVTISFQ